MSRPPEPAPRYEPPRLLRSYRVEELLRGATDVFLGLSDGPFKPEPAGDPGMPQPPISRDPDAAGAIGDDLI